MCVTLFKFEKEPQYGPLQTLMYRNILACCLQEISVKFIRSCWAVAKIKINQQSTTSSNWVHQAQEIAKQLLFLIRLNIHQSRFAGVHKTRQADSVEVGNFRLPNRRPFWRCRGNQKAYCCHLRQRTFEHNGKPDKYASRETLGLRGRLRS